MWRAARKPVSPSEKAVVASCSPPKMAIFNMLLRLESLLLILEAQPDRLLLQPPLLLGRAPG